MLGLAPDRRGLLPESDVARLNEFGAAIQKRYGANLITQHISNDTVDPALDAILLAPVIALPLVFVASLALASMMMLLIVTGAAVALTIAGDVARRIWRNARQPVVIPRRALG